MATAKTVWGIDVGQCALKALKLSSIDGEVQVEAFDIIEHPKILSQPDADRSQLIRNALEQFLARNNVVGSTVVVSVPGTASLACFVKLPPVQSANIAKIVGYEAEQQIPFPIDEVIWRWQTFHDPESPDVEVGIFAIKRTDMYSSLEHFSNLAISVDAVQMAPLALYNFMTYDEQLAEDGATLLVDVGAEKSDLIVADKGRIWTRTVQIGGNSFTEALVRSFKLRSFSKAERLKRTAVTSKYAKQIFQAMRPVFADLVQQIQRSVGRYTSLHRETRFTRIIGLGNGFRLPGLQKYLEQNLGIPVVRIDSYNKLKGSGPANTPIFTENVMSLAVAYGLALQGLNQTTITTNLLPAEISRARLWSSKKPWFGAAAAILLATLAVPMWRSRSDLGAIETRSALAHAKSVDQRIMRMQSRYGQLVNQGREEQKTIERFAKMYGYHNVQPTIMNMISQSISEVASDQPAMSDDNEQRAEELEKLKSVDRHNRRMIVLDQLEMTYLPNVVGETLMSRTTSPSPGTDGQGAPAIPDRKPQRGLKVIFTGRTPMGLQNAERMLRNLLAQSEQHALVPPYLPDGALRVLHMLPEATSPPVGIDPPIWEEFINAVKDGKLAMGEDIPQNARQCLNAIADQRVSSPPFGIRIEEWEVFVSAVRDGKIPYLTSPIKVLEWQLLERSTMAARGGSSSSTPSRRRPAPRVPGMSPLDSTEQSTTEPEVAMPDPMFPTEDMSGDTWFKIGWIIGIENDGVPMLETS